ncbi:FISUMP domain-containing protein [Riemerella anatipestifer]|nr:FISUMP domain-containing protein [Riemerella anatipestifer]MDY3325212.1 FISUMP domain-containing protein [Riemerella anatipestifer]MDY3352798.1 FISUMP domain-containing protein [Riemerella anatipestifer]
MKKTLLCAMFLPLVLNAQDYNGRVGINTKEPQATLDISKKELNTLPSGHTQGVLFPEFSTTERSTFTSPKKGTMIYNTDKNCVEIYQGVVSGVHQWTCMPGSNQTQSVAVKAAGFEGSYVGGVAFTSANKAKFKLENNSFGNISSAFHDAITVHNGSASISAGNCQWQKLPTGGVAPCTSGSLISLNSGESAMLWYTLSGTPETGTLTANFNKLGAQADQSTAVGLGSATIISPKTEYVVSLTYNGTELQGKITNGMTVKIPYTGGSGSYNAAVATPTATAPGQGGDMNTVSLSIPSGNFLVSGDLVATLTVDGDGVYNVTKKAPGEQYDIATIPYSINGTNYELKLVGIGGIPDRCFGKTTRQCLADMGSPSPWASTEMEHQFIYIPITGPDGKTWLNNNLGAEYARVGSSWFNPTYQAGSLDYTKTTTAEAPTILTADHIKKDWRAYGSLFQWQRKPDGHELITWASSTSGTPKYTASTTLASSWANAGTNKFIPYKSSDWSWVTPSVNQQTSSHQLWRANGANNPCPVGYHVPTYAEWQALHTAITGATDTNYSNNSNMWNETDLRLPVSGLRWDLNGSFYFQSSNGIFWSSEAYDSSYSWLLWFGSSSSYAGRNNYRALGVSVRCIKDN